MGVVRYVGIKLLTTTEQEKLKKLVLQYMEKLDRYFVDYTCRFHVKLHDVKGKPEYSFHARIYSPQFLFSADATDWDLRRTVHKVMKKIMNHAEHTYHREGQKQQRFHPSKAKRGTDKRIKLKLKGWWKLR